jgi:hypothetical protein
VGKAEQVGAFGVVELQSAGDRVQHRCGGARDRAAFEFGVVLDADPGQGGNLAASEAWHPSFAVDGQPGFGRGDLGSPRDQELADLVTVVHEHRRYDVGPDRWDALSVHPTIETPNPSLARVD